MKHTRLRNMLAWLVVLALCAGMLPGGLAEEAGPDAPVEELQGLMLGDGAEAVGAEEDAQATVEVEIEAIEAALSSEEISGEMEAAEAREDAPEGAEASDAGAALLAAASGFHLNAESLRLGAGERFDLTATMDGLPISEPSFESNAPKVVSVSGSGRLRARKAGSAVVSVTWGGYAAECAVEVVEAPSKVRISRSTATLGAGQQLRLKSAVPGGTASAITWKSSRTSVARVDESGLVTAVAKGTAKITATTFNGKTATCRLTVTAAPTAIAFERNTLALSVGQSYTPSVKLTGGSGAYRLTSDGDAVRVSKGTLIAEGTGSAVVTAAAYNGLTARLSVTVNPAPASVRFSQATYVLGVKDTLKLTPIFDVKAPDGLTFKTTSSKVASVSAEGVVTGKKAGRAKIGVFTYNGLSAVCVVQVCKAPSKVTLNRTSLTLGAGETFQLKGILPENTLSALAWASDDPAVAAVDQGGLVTAKGQGTAKITVTTANKKKATCRVKVSALPTRLALSKSRVVLNPGKTATVSWKLEGVGAVETLIEDTGIAKIDRTAAKKVRVRAVAPGETVLRASTINGLSDTLTIVVAPVATYLRLPKSSVTLRVGDRYTIAPDTDAGGPSALSFSSGNAAVARVSRGGVVAAVGKGSATITVKTVNGQSAKLRVTVKDAAALSLAPSSLELAPYEYRVLEVSPSEGVSFTSSNTYVAYVSQDGVVTGVHGGEATITAANGQGGTAVCRVRVIEAGAAPAAPASVKLSVIDANSLLVEWTPVSGADGYRVYTGTGGDPGQASLYGGFGASATGLTLTGLNPGITWHVFVTAYNFNGETDIYSATHAQAQTPGETTSHTVSLNYSGEIMLALGAQKALTAVISPADYTGALTWSASTGAVTFLSRDEGGCVLYGEDSGEARVTATLDNGRSASLRVRVVDTLDISDVNLTNVQKAVARNGALMNVDEGGDVVWSIVEGRLENSGMTEERAGAIVERIKGSEELFRSLYVLALGAYGIAAETTRDKRGSLLGVSQFLLEENTLYLLPSSSSAENYAYAALHETGHALDYNGADRNGLLSENDEAHAAICADVRQLLLERVDEAVAAAGVSAARVSGENVVDAIMDYRTLLDESAALARLNSEERQVYARLTDLMEAEMSATLPINNGSMVWDTVEGATNFAVSGDYGHSYLLDNPIYHDAAQYYYYDASGKASIAAEPWAEFFSAKLMQDAATLAANITYLPRTCQYFTETLAPKLLDFFRNAVTGK